ncbi:Bacteriophage related protein of unknown function [Roseateles sp. YR242]|uniref:phage tail terminator-like protein n=1 Tax=Roseateles sp. YR242 TaxID=1855305 RepID=UPI0008B6834E|nr:phage tail terminator-like protein [Roseateles sp. YR242]SEL12057.1 Bacteriophage related protein of unknown function [Roseateles sp. YR242]
MSNKIIRAAFETRLAAWAAAQVPPIPVAYENGGDFTPPSDRSRYAHCYLMPVDLDTQTVDMKHLVFEGLFQVTLFMPAGEGNGPTDDLCESLATTFSPTAPMVRAGLPIFITRPMGRRSGDPEDGYFVVPVSCAYRADTYPNT